MNYQLIQDNLKTLLDIHGMKQTTLADLLGVKPRTVNRWIRGKSKGEPTNIPNPQLKRIADLFNISLEEFTLLDLSHEIKEHEEALNRLSENSENVQALNAYLTAIGVSIECLGKWEDDKEVLPKAVKLTWSNDNSTETKIINRTSFDALARKFHDLAMLEIKHIY